MFHRSLFTLATLAIALGALGLAAARAEDTKDDLKKLAGAWKCASKQIDGGEVPADVAKMLGYTFKGDTLTMRGGLARAGDRYIPTATTHSYKVKLGAKDDLKTIDLAPTAKGNKIAGIYKFEDGKLVLCLGLNGKRPEKFESKNDSATDLSTLEKAKP